jgi:hypothetical protein
MLAGTPRSASYEARNGIPINCNSFRASSSSLRGPLPPVCFAGTPRSASYEARNGIPINCNSFRASSSVFAVVTTDTFMPRALSTFM